MKKMRFRVYLTLGLIMVLALLLRLVHVHMLAYSPVSDQKVYPSYGEMFMKVFSGEKLSDFD